MPRQADSSAPNQDGRQQPTARELLLTWARAHAYRDQATAYLKRARSSSDADVRDRFVVIAQHYCTLAKAEERSAEQATARRASTDGLH
jgi:hypothetical protein